MNPSFEATAVLALGSRPEQQDAVAILDPDGTEPGQGEAFAGPELNAAVADGMGGHAGGATASESMIAAFRHAARQQDRAFGARMGEALGQAVETLKDVAEQDETKADLGTTFLGVRFADEAVDWVSVGDSPLFLWREGKLTRLNADHSQRAHGDIAHSTVLSSAVSTARPDAVDTAPKPRALRDGDIVLLASDGILTLPEESLAETLEHLSKVPTAEAAEALLRRVTDAEMTDQDNTAIVFVRVGTLPDVVGDTTRVARMGLILMSAAAFITAVLAFGSIYALGLS